MEVSAPDSPAMGVRPEGLRSRKRLWAKLAAVALSGRVPFRVGDVVIGDDPFNGRNVGVVVEVSGSILELRCGGGSQDRYVYYDYRSVAKYL